MIRGGPGDASSRAAAAGQPSFPRSQCKCVVPALTLSQAERVAISVHHRDGREGEQGRRVAICARSKLGHSLPTFPLPLSPSPLPHHSSDRSNRSLARHTCCQGWWSSWLPSAARNCAQRGPAGDWDPRDRWGPWREVGRQRRCGAVEGCVPSAARLAGWSQRRGPGAGAGWSTHSMRAAGVAAGPALPACAWCCALVGRPGSALNSGE